MKKTLKIAILTIIILLSVFYVYKNKHLLKILINDYSELPQQLLLDNCSITTKGVKGSDKVVHSNYDGGFDLIFTDEKKVGNKYFMYTKIKIVKNSITISEITTIPREYFDGFVIGENDVDCSVDGRFITISTVYISAYPDGDQRCENGNCEILRGQVAPIKIDLKNYKNTSDEEEINIQEVENFNIKDFLNSETIDDFEYSSESTYYGVKKILEQNGWLPIIPTLYETNSGTLPATTTPIDTEFPEISYCGSGRDAVCTVDFQKGKIIKHFYVGHTEANEGWVIVGSE